MYEKNNEPGNDKEKIDTVKKRSKPLKCRQRLVCDGCIHMEEYHSKRCQPATRFKRVDFHSALSKFLLREPGRKLFNDSMIFWFSRPCR